MAETLCDSGAVKFKAGVNANTTITGDPARLTQYINQAEGDIFVDTAIDWVDKYSGISANFKQVLDGACSNKAAIYVIEGDPDAIGRASATFMVNVLWASYDRVIRELRTTDIKAKIGAT